MFASALIVFREVLEAALVLSIVAAATKSIPGRNHWLTVGLATGILGSLLVAGFASQIAEAMEGMGQEVFNASILLVAVVMLGWHNVWMQSHGRNLAARMSKVGTSAASGSLPLYAVATAVAIAILREGSEIVLFMYGIASSGANAAELALGSAMGLGLGAALGFAIYAGLLSLPIKHLFKVTGWMILLLAAGMAATAAKYLTQADLLPAFGNTVWDTTTLLSEDSPFGQLLHILIGYTARPSGIQLIFYAATLLTIGALMLLVNRPKPKLAVTAINTTAAFACILSLAAISRDAQAGFKVYTPYVEYREFEIEYRPEVSFDSVGTEDNEQKHLLGLGYGVTEWWFTEVYAEWEREGGPGHSTDFEAFEWENRFQLSTPGEDWADFGLLVEYERTDSGSAPDKIELALLLAKEVGQFDAAFNLIVEREVGTNASDDLELGQAFQLKYRLDSMLEPGFEIYSEFGAIDDMPGFDEQEHYAGPIIQGVIPLNDSGTKLKYNVGYMVGLTDHTHDGVTKAVIELEFPL